jgi:hypothetical protein
MKCSGRQHVVHLQIEFTVPYRDMECGADGEDEEKVRIQE